MAAALPRVRVDFTFSLAAPPYPPGPIKVTGQADGALSLGERVEMFDGAGSIALGVVDGIDGDLVFLRFRYGPFEGGAELGEPWRVHWDHLAAGREAYEPACQLCDLLRDCDEEP